MTWRKWLVRGLVFTCAGALIASALLYQSLTHPAVVRRQVVEKLGHLLIGAHIHLESAQMYLLGGISATDLRLTRRDDPDQEELAYIPSAVVYPDKEKIVGGQLAIRKVVLCHPRLHVRRGADGRWNVAGILGIPHPDEPIPTIEVQDGTMLFEDRLVTPAPPVVEIVHVNGTFLNDPVVVMNFEGTGKSDLAGSLKIEGTWNRQSDAVALTLQANGIDVGPRLVKRLAPYGPDAATHAAQLSGTGSLQAELAYSPQGAHPWTYKLQGRLAHGRLQHPQIPWDLDELDASFRCLDGQSILDNVTARSGTARWHLSGKIREFRADADCEAVLTAEHLPISPAILARLPANLHKIKNDFAPVGPITVTARLARQAGHWRKRYLIQLEDISATFIKFPFPVQHATGTVDQVLDTREQLDVMQVDLSGLAGERRVFAKGTITGEGIHATIALKVWGENFPLDDQLRAALPEPQQKLVHAFQPSGLADFEAHVHRTPGTLEFSNRYIIRFHDAQARYELFPYPLEQVNGILDIQPDHWEFYDFQATHQGATIAASGRSYPTSHGDQLVIEVRGDHVLLDTEFAAALEPRPDLKRAWQMLAPGGRMKFAAHVDRLPDQEPEVDVSLTAQGCSLRPTFFPYSLSGLTGTMRYAQQKVWLTDLRASHGATVLTLDRGRIHLKPEGGVQADIATLRASPLVPDADLMRALPRGLREGCQAVGFKDPVDLKTALRVVSFPDGDAFPDIYWDGEMTLYHTSLDAGIRLEDMRGRAACRGRYNRHQMEGLQGNVQLEQATVLQQPFRNLRSEIRMPKESPNVLVLPGLYAQVFGGAVYGPARIEIGPQLRYELNLTAAQVDLAQLTQHNLHRESQVRGQATASLYLTGQGTGLNDITGRGSFDLKDGRLYNLPLVFDLLKLPTLRLPDGTMFEEAHAAFAVQGKRLAVSRIDLLGNAVSLRGQGDVNWDGSDLQLDFYAVWARMAELLPPVIKDIQPTVSKQLLKIKMRGGINDVRITTEPVPLLVEPVKDLWDRMNGRH
jgi:hypothetical protein